MGGVGSGRTTYASRPTTEACRSISIGKLQRAGALTEGWSGSWRWSIGGSEVASIRISGGLTKIIFLFRSREAGGDWGDVVEPVGIEWRRCRFGGERPLFKCPGVVNGAVCGRSVQDLYAGGRYFLCLFLNGLPPHFADKTREPIIKAIAQLDALTDEIMLALDQPITEQKAA